MVSFAMWKIFDIVLSSRSFMVLYVTSKSLIHLMTLLVWCKVKAQIYFLHVAVQFSKNHLLKSLSSSHGIFLAALLYIN